jgi:hypothetical protein
MRLWRGMDACRNDPDKEKPREKTLIAGFFESRTRKNGVRFRQDIELADNRQARLQ